jgi:DNA end-binding protein Ku
MPRRSSAPRPFWSGTISFGLVSVPVSLHPASRPGGAPLRLLAPDGTPVRRVYVCPAEDRVVPAEHIVRGYDAPNGRRIVVEDEELEALAPEKTRDIDLQSFVPREQLPLELVERVYYLMPEGRALKAYRLLAAVMERSGRAGIARLVLRGVEHLVAIVADRGVLRADTLRFHDELRTPEHVGLPALRRPAAAEVTRLARTIAKRTRDDLDRRLLADVDARRLRELAERKLARRRDVVEATDTEEPETARTVDLMEQLRKSFGARRTA